MYFYELHESDDELFTTALLAHPQAFDERGFFDMVMQARVLVIGGFEEDSLVAAIAHQLERSHGFVYVDERRLTAAVNVSLVEADNVIAAPEGGDDASGDEDDDDWDDGGEEAGADADLDEDFRSIVLRVDRTDLN